MFFLISLLLLVTRIVGQILKPIIRRINEKYRTNTRKNEESSITLNSSIESQSVKVLVLRHEVIFRGFDTAQSIRKFLQMVSDCDTIENAVYAIFFDIDLSYPDFCEEDLKAIALQTLGEYQNHALISCIIRDPKTALEKNIPILWERKRGKIIELNRFLLGREDHSVKVIVPAGDSLSDITHVVTLDSDSVIEKSDLEKLRDIAGQPQYHASGYVIFQPIISSEMQNFNSATATFWSSVLVPKKSAADFFQSVFQRTLYKGKGMYDLHAFFQLFDELLPTGCILNHDSIESMYAPTLHCADIVIKDSVSSSLPHQLRQRERWFRGNFQNLLLVMSGRLPKFPDALFAFVFFFERTRDDVLIPIQFYVLLKLLVVPLTPPTVLLAALSLLNIFGFFTPVLVLIDPVRCIRSLKIGLYSLVTLPLTSGACLLGLGSATWRYVFGSKKLLEWRSSAIVERDSESGRYQLQTLLTFLGTAFVFTLCTLAVTSPIHQLVVVFLIWSVLTVIFAKITA